MDKEISPILVSSIMNRKALLWIVNESSSSQAVDDIQDIARFYWEACWTQSIENGFYDISKRIADASEYNPERGLVPRQPFRFSADPDRVGDINRHAFLPIYETEGSSHLNSIRVSFQPKNALLWVCLME